MATKTIDLTPFCDPETSRFAINKPFNQKGFTCATDGRVIVRIPTDEPDTPATDKKIPDVSQLAWNHAACTQWKPLKKAKRKKVTEIHQQGCPKCETCPCDECEGEGFLLTVNGIERDCHDCEGSGFGNRSTSCPECHGTGYVHYVFDLGGALIAPRYHAKLLTLDSVEYASPTTEKGPVLLRFDGGEAILMPLDLS